MENGLLLSPVPSDVRTKMYLTVICLRYLTFNG